MGAIEHHAVIHPRSLLPTPGWQDRLIVKLTDNLGASTVTFWVAFVVPLAILPLSNTVKLVTAVISGSWYQWWMLTGIQRSQVRGAERITVKADADHQALTHIALTADKALDMATRSYDLMAARQAGGSATDARGEGL